MKKWEKELFEEMSEIGKISDQECKCRTLSPCNCKACRYAHALNEIQEIIRNLKEEDRKCIM
jgi:predicted Zn-ribbon and HTH transcriptional regulator